MSRRIVSIRLSSTETFVFLMSIIFCGLPVFLYFVSIWNSLSSKELTLLVFFLRRFCCRIILVEGDYARVASASEPFIYFYVGHGNFGWWRINLLCIQLLWLSSLSIRFLFQWNYPFTLIMVGYEFYQLYICICHSGATDGWHSFPLWSLMILLKIRHGMKED